MTQISDFPSTGSNKNSKACKVLLAVVILAFQYVLYVYRMIKESIGMLKLMYKAT